MPSAPLAPLPRRAPVGRPTLISVVVTRLPVSVQRWLVRTDPGMLRTARATRAMVAFLLMLLAAWAVSVMAGVPLMGLTLGFPVTLFACAVIGDDVTPVRHAKIGALAATAAVMFTLSSVLHPAWVNHLVFVLVVGLAAWTRQLGGTFLATSTVANVSYFFGAFLEPALSELPLQLFGVVLGAASALVVHELVVPHRPERRLRWAVTSLHMRLADLLDVLGTTPAPERSTLVPRLRRVQEAVGVAESHLNALPGGRTANKELAERLSTVMVITERLSLRAGLGVTVLDAAACGEAEGLALALRGGQHLEPGERFAPLVEAVQHLDEVLERAPSSGQVADEAPVQVVSSLPPESPGLRIPVQASAATALAILAGTALSEDRWYWAVITVFVMFTGTQSRGQALTKSLERVFGTFVGIVAGIGLVGLLGGNQAVAFVVMPVAVFCMYWAFIQSYVWMMFFLSIVLALLFALTGRFTDALMVLRLEETMLGAASGVLVSAFLFPRQTGAHAHDQFGRVLRRLDDLLAVTMPAERPDRRALAAARHDFDDELALFRDAIRPMGFVPVRSNRQGHHLLQRDADLVSYWTHELTLLVRLGDSARERPADPAQRQAVDAVRHAIRSLEAPTRSELPAAPDARPPRWETIPFEASAIDRALAVAAEELQRSLVLLDRALRDARQSSPGLRY